jgi:transcriptional regulator with XRE-family HTH domain
MHKIASNIRHLRKLKNWSQEMLAEQLGISRASIGSYEESRCEPPLDTIINLSTLFHVAIDALVS